MSNLNFNNCKQSRQAFQINVFMVRNIYKNTYIINNKQLAQISVEVVIFLISLKATQLVANKSLNIQFKAI